jgi:hypothetical protein
MISGTAVSILSTLTRINTLLLATSKCDWTVWITQTLIRDALPVWVTFVILKAKASGSVVARLAVGISTTSLKKTWVLTLSFDARFVIWTFKITFATS